VIHAELVDRETQRERVFDAAGGDREVASKVFAGLELILSAGA
jgi:hypothetical protein